MQDNYGNSKVSLMNLNTPLFSSGGSSMVFPTVMEGAYGVWSTKDVFGAGGNVIELVSSGASPSTRNFTATELTDGTYASWVSSAPTVRTLYDQKGSNNLANGFSGTAPLYIGASNTIKFDKGGFYGNTRQLTVNVGNQLDTDFGGNTVTPHSQVTFAINAKDTTGSKGTGTQAMFGAIDSAPTVAINQRGKLIVQNDSDQKVGLRQRDGSYTIFDTIHDTAMGSSFENYIGGMQRNINSQNLTQTLFDLFVDGTQEIDADTNTLNTACQTRQFIFGGSRFESQIAIAFDKTLTPSEITELNTAMDNL
jgi:hypothetical protein